MKYLGRHFDIHTGGEDNIFPHHENEIAQSEACTGETFVNYWLHCRHLLVEGEKMAKSRGNFFTLRDLISQGHHPMAIRYFIISSHYRSPINLSQEALGGAFRRSRIMDFRTRVQEILEQADSGKYSVDLQAVREKCVREFQEYMDDDLDSPRALAALFDMIRDANKILDEQPVGHQQAQEILALLERMDKVLGVMHVQDEMLDEEIERLIQERQDARKRRDFATSDRIRDELAARELFWKTPRGVRWKRR